MVRCEILENGESAVFTCNHSYNACSELEEYPFNQFKRLIHEIYKTHKPGDAVGERRGGTSFNPLKMAAEEGGMGLDPSTEEMVKAIHGVVFASC